MRVEPTKALSFPGYTLDLIPEDDAEREILLGMFDEFYEGKRKPWIASIHYTDNRLKSMTLRMVRRSKFRKTVRAELKRLNELHESQGESLGLLFARVKECEDRLATLEKLIEIGAKNWIVDANRRSTLLEHKCNHMPDSVRVERECPNFFWKLHITYPHSIAKRIDFCPYCGVKLS